MQDNIRPFYLILTTKFELFFTTIAFTCSVEMEFHYFWLHISKMQFHGICFYLLLRNYIYVFSIHEAVWATVQIQFRFRIRVDASLGVARDFEMTAEDNWNYNTFYQTDFQYCWKLFMQQIKIMFFPSKRRLY